MKQVFLIVNLQSFLLTATGMVREKGPEHDHVQEQKDPKNSGDSTLVKCLYCELVFSATATRIRAHLLGWSGCGVRACTSCPEPVKQKFEELEKAKKEAQFRKRKLDQLDRATSGAASTHKQSSLHASFRKQDRSAVDQLWGRAFFGNGLPFRFANDPYFKDAVKATAAFGESYTAPPSADKLRTTILQQERELKGLEAYKEQVSFSGATITSDGWSDVRRRPLLNLLVVSPKGELYLKAVDTCGEVKDATFIAARLAEAIHEVGAENVVQVVMDSAAVCKAAGRLIEEQFPWITWTPCTPHCLDLLLEDVGKLPWAASVVAEATSAVKFITNHHMSLALFRQRSKLDLLKPADTRFATNFIMLQRLQEVKEALQQLVVSGEWTGWNEKSSHQETGEEVRDSLVSAALWKGIRELLAVSEGMVRLMRECDRGVPILGKVYVAMFNVGEELKQLKNGSSEAHPQVELTAQKYEQVNAIWRKRWEMLHSDMHSAGYVLDPEYQSPDNGQHTNVEVMNGFHNIVEKLLPDVDEQVKAIEQLAKYRNGEGTWGRPMVRESAKRLPG